MQSSRVTEQKRGRLGRKQGGRFASLGAHLMAFAFCQAKKVVDIRLCCSLLVRFANRHTALAARQRRSAEAQAVAAAMHLQRYAAALPQSCMMYFEQ